MMFRLTLKFGLHRFLRTDQRRKSRNPCIAIEDIMEPVVKPDVAFTFQCSNLFYVLFFRGFAGLDMLIHCLSVT